MKKGRGKKIKIFEGKIECDIEISVDILLMII